MQIEYFMILTASYLIGAISFSYIVAKIFGGIDIRAEGSGNVGARNVARCLNIKFGFISGLLDLLKGFFPIAFLRGSGYSGFLFLSAGCMLVIGHNWSVVPGWLFRWV